MGNKIFITLGSQKFQFNRLLKAVDWGKRQFVHYGFTLFGSFFPKTVC